MKWKSPLSPRRFVLKKIASRWIHLGMFRWDDTVSATNPHVALRLTRLPRQLRQLVPICGLRHPACLEMYAADPAVASPAMDAWLSTFRGELTLDGSTLLTVRGTSSTETAGEELVGCRQAVQWRAAHHDPRWHSRPI